jgi:hypothetical protein
MRPVNSGWNNDLIGDLYIKKNNSILTADRSENINGQETK